MTAANARITSGPIDRSPLIAAAGELRIGVIATFMASSIQNPEAPEQSQCTTADGHGD